MENSNQSEGKEVIRCPMAALVSDHIDRDYSMSISIKTTSHTDRIFTRYNCTGKLHM